MSETLLVDAHPRSNVRDTGCFRAVSRKTLRKALCALASYIWIGFWLSSLASNMYDFWSFTFDQTRNSYSLSPIQRSLGNTEEHRVMDICHWGPSGRCQGVIYRCQRSQVIPVRDERIGFGMRVEQQGHRWGAWPKYRLCLNFKMSLETHHSAH